MPDPCGRSGPAPGRRAALAGLAALWSGGIALHAPARQGAFEPAAHEVLHGPRVFPLALEPGLGLRGSFAYGGATAILRDPVRLELVRIDARGEPDGPFGLALAEERVREHDLERRWEGEGLGVEERVWVGQSDELVAQLRFTSRAAEDLELELHVFGGATPGLDRSRARQQPIAFPMRDWVDPDVLRLGVPPAGLLELDGLRFALAPYADGRRAAVLAPAPGSRAAGDEDRGRVELELPSTRPIQGRLHALLALAAPLGESEGVPGTCEVSLDDGGVESLGWPAARSLSVSLAPGRSAAVAAQVPAQARGRVEWRAVGVAGLERSLLLFAYTPPPGRFAIALSLRHAGGPESGALLAATLELPHPEGRLPVAVGEASLDGTPVALALAATGALPLVRDDGRRVLVRRLSLAPGQEIQVVAATVPGVRGFQAALMAMGLAEDEPVGDALLLRHVAAREAWRAAHLPVFRSSDEELERGWRRALVQLLSARRSLGLADFSLPVLYEGACCGDHARISPLDATLSLRDLRWLAEDDTAQGTVRALLKRQRPDGLLAPIAPGRAWRPEPHALAAAVLDAFAVSGSEQFLREALPLLERDLEARLEAGSASDRAEHTLLHSSLEAVARARRALGEPERAAGPEERPEHRTSFDALGQPAPYLAAARELLAMRAPSSCPGPAPRGFLDHVIGERVGLRPEVDGRLVIDPDADQLDSFHLTNVRHRGRSIAVSWGRPEAAPEGDEERRFSIEVDGRIVHEGPRLERVELF